MLRLEGVTKRFAATTAVDQLDLEVVAGEFVSLLGPSGCGKTTTLRLIAGFESPTQGRILVRNQDVTSQPPHRRGIGMVFQNYALFPHLTVFENVAFGLREQHVAKAEIGARVQRAIQITPGATGLPESATAFRWTAAAGSIGARTGAGAATDIAR